MIDSEPVWWEIEKEMFAQYGGVWTEEMAKALVGSDLHDSAVVLIAHFERRDVDPDDLVREMVVRVEEHFRAGVRWQPGVRRLLDELAAAGVPMAIVTASHRNLVDALLSHLPDVPFGAIVTGDEVENGKPHPEPYQRAADGLGADPAACVAIEDSVNGAASAQAAGCYVLAVPQVVTPPGAPRRTVVRSLDDVDLTYLQELVRSVDVPGHA